MSAMAACTAVVLPCTQGNSLKLEKREGVDKDRFFLLVSVVAENGE